MILAFALYKFFPFGGLQRDFLRIAMACQTRGHSIRVYTYSWQGDIPDGFDVRILAKKGITSQSRNIRFSRQMFEDLDSNPVDKLIGFNKMPELDVYYAADGCYEQRVRDLYRGLGAVIYRMAGRYRHFSEYEYAVFSAQSATEILMISATQQALFQDIYQTQDKRLHMLPPGISRDRCAPENSLDIRAELRSELAINADEFVLLMVGSGFKTKGVDRSISALANLPDKMREKTRLLVVGQDKADQFIRQAESLGVQDRVVFLSGRSDVPRFLLAADVLLHPARHENTGTVLLEALVAGLPVLCTGVCGYSSYIAESESGRVTAQEFSQLEFDNYLLAMLSDEELRKTFSANALGYAKTADLYSMPERAADIIEGGV